jgi:hypothetical protein
MEIYITEINILHFELQKICYPQHEISALQINA